MRYMLYYMIYIRYDKVMLYIIYKVCMHHMYRVSHNLLPGGHSKFCGFWKKVSITTLKSGQFWTDQYTFDQKIKNKKFRLPRGYPCDAKNSKFLEPHFSAQNTVLAHAETEFKANFKKSLCLCIKTDFRSLILQKINCHISSQGHKLPIP